MITKEELKLTVKAIELTISLDQDYKVIVYLSNNKINEIHHLNKVKKETKAKIEKIINKHFAY